MINTEQLRQFCYCPRKIYWRDIAQISRPASYLMDHGTNYHLKKVSRAYIHKGSKTHREFFLSNDDLDLKGIADAILEFPNYLVAVEYKHSIPNPIPRGYRLQLVAIGMLAELHFNKKVEHLEFRTHNGLLFKLSLDESSRKEVMDVLKQIKNLVESEEFPVSCGNSRKCQPCEYNNICNSEM